MRTDKSKLGIGRTALVVVVIVIILIAAVGALYAGGVLTPSSSTTTATSTATSTATITSTVALAPINIGFITEETGSFAPLGSEAAVAARAAVSEINSNGGIDGRQMNLIILDSQTTPTQGVTDAQQLVTQDNVLAITGTTSSAVALAVAGYTQQNSIPYVVPIAQDPGLTSPNSTWTVRVTPDSVSAGAALAKYMLSLNPNAKIAIAASQITYFEQIAKGVSWYVQNATKGSVVYDQTFPASQTDFSTAVAQIKADNPNFIVNDLVNFGNFYTGILQAGFNSSQVFVDTDEASNTIPLGSAGADVYTGSLFNIALANSSNGVVAFNSKMTPVVASCSSCGKTVTEDSYFSYITMYMIKNAIQSALSTGSLTRQSFMTAMKNTVYHDSILGNTFQFNQNGATASWYYIVQLTNVNPTNQTYTEKVVAYYTFPTGEIPAYKIATSP